MENGDKIEKLSQIRSKLLPREIVDKDKKLDDYSLEEEFSKSHSNRRILFYSSSILIFIGILVGSAYLVYITSEKEYRKGKAGKDYFEGMRLKSLIESSKNATAKLALVKRQISELEEELKREKKIIEDESEKKIKAIEQKEISQKKRDELISEEELSLKARVEELESTIREKIDEKNKDIKNLNEQIALQKKEVEQEISAAERIVQNARRLQKLKADELIAEYDPVLNERRILNILRNKNKYSWKESPKIGSYKDELKKEASVSQKDFAKRIKYTKDINELTKRMSGLPHKKSIPKLVKRINSLSKEVVEGYELLWTNLYKTIQRKNQLMENYKHAFNSLLISEHENGYILNARNKSKVHVYINNIFKTQKGTQAIVFREDDEFIGKISITSFRSSNDAMARVIEIAEYAKIKPFDKILIISR